MFMGALNPFWAALFLPSALCSALPKKGLEGLTERYSAGKPALHRHEVLLFSTLASVMVARLTFLFLRLGDLDLMPIFLYMSELCALQDQENFCCQWYNLPKLRHFAKTNEYLVLK